MFNKIIPFIILFLVTVSYGFSADKLHIVVTTTDLADIVRNVGGDKVEVISLTKGNQDLHVIEPRPSMAVSIRNANLVVRIGMDMDGWVNSLIDLAKNSKVMKGTKGDLDVSTGVEKLEVPVGKVDFGMGDIHIYGNPHLWLDPENGKIIAKEVANKLSELMPEGKEYFNKNCGDYTAQLDTSIKKWLEIMKPYQGTKIVTYHSSLPYFAKRFGLTIAGMIEPKPGIPPTPSHILELEEKMKTEGVKLIVIEPFYNVEIAKEIAQNTGAKVCVIPSSIGGAAGVSNYIGLFDYDVSKVAETLK